MDELGRRAPRPTRCLGPLSAGAGGDQRVESLRARFCIERGRYWQAEYWISGVRDYTLSLACDSRGLPAHHGRGFETIFRLMRGTALRMRSCPRWSGMSCFARSAVPSRVAAGSN
jgi:hypothetical protein